MNFFLKVDLKNADPERVEKQIEKVFDIPSDECIKVKYPFSWRHALKNVGYWPKWNFIVFDSPSIYKVFIVLQSSFY